MTGPQDWLSALLAKWYQTLFVNGVQQPQEANLALVAGAGIALANADNPTTGTSVVTISNTLSAGGVPVAPAAIFSATGSYAAPTQDITVPFDVSGGDVTMTLTGAPTPGVKLTLKDAKKALASHSFRLISQGSGVIDDPANLAGAATSEIVMGVANPNGYVVGGSVTLQWIPSVGTGGTWCSE